MSFIFESVERFIAGTVGERRKRRKTLSKSLPISLRAWLS